MTMGIGDKAILAGRTDLKETTMMVDEDLDLSAFIMGADETEEHAQEIGKMIEESIWMLRQRLCGGQPICTILLFL